MKYDWIEGPPPGVGAYWLFRPGEPPFFARSTVPGMWATATHHIPLPIPARPRPPKPEPGWYVIRDHTDRGYLDFRQVREDSDCLFDVSRRTCAPYWEYEFGPKLPEGWEPT